MFSLNEEQQKALLVLARKTISDELNLENTYKEYDYSEEIFCEKCGAFVTLHKKGNLRGCIGYITGIKPLHEAIMDMAISASFRDPRFPPLQEEEFDSIDIEISVMSPIEMVTDVKVIEVGRDGLIITQDGACGLLLPQVATEQGWDRDTFLDHTCVKACLPKYAWKDPKTKIEKFSAQVFGEIELNMIN